jgi:hypothetical protein
VDDDDEAQRVEHTTIGMDSTKTVKTSSQTIGYTTKQVRGTRRGNAKASTSVVVVVVGVDND